MFKYIIIYLGIIIITHGVYNSDNKTLIKVYFWTSVVGISFLYFMDSIHALFLFCSTMILFNLHQETLEDIQRREQEETARRLEYEIRESKKALENWRSTPDHF